MTTRPLRKLTEIKTGKLDVNAGSDDGVYPFFTCANTPYKINNYAFDNEAVLIAGNGDLNVKYYKGKFNAYQRTYVIQNKDEEILSMKYLYYFMETYMDRLRNSAIGGIIKYIKLGHLNDAEIPLPDIKDQKRIAYLLSKVGGLITQRKQHLQQLDDLLKSVFLEMFGDPIRNDKGWDIKPLAKLGNLDRGVSKHRPRNAPELLGGQYPLIQTGDVSNAGTFIENYTQTYSELGFQQSKLWPVGTLCITIAANIAQTAILKFDSCFPDSVVGFTPENNESNSIYVLGLFWFFQRILEKNAPAAAQKNINLKILRELDVPSPPVPLQNQFATIVEKVESIKSLYQQSLNDLETLYGSLSQKAFKGELDLSSIPLPDFEDIESNIQIDAVAESDEATIVFSSEQMASVEGRRSILKSLFKEYIADKANLTKTLDQFWNEIKSKTLEYSLFESEDFPERQVTVDDYDHLKEWIFGGLRSGRFEQKYLEDEKRIQLQVPKA